MGSQLVRPPWGYRRRPGWVHARQRHSSTDGGLDQSSPASKAASASASAAASSSASTLASPSASAYKQPWHERLFGRGLEGMTDDEPAGSGDFSTMFNARRLQTAKAALEPRLRCTEVDENGRVTMREGEFKKTELIAKVRVSVYFLSVCTRTHTQRRRVRERNRANRQINSTASSPATCARSTHPTCPTS